MTTKIESEATSDDVWLQRCSVSFETDLAMTASLVGSPARDRVVSVNFNSTSEPRPSIHSQIEWPGLRVISLTHNYERTISQKQAAMSAGPEEKVCSAILKVCFALAHSIRQSLM
jgi:hypothetical protein